MKVKVRCSKFECQKDIILRPNRDQLRKMQLQGLRLGIEPAPSGSLDQCSTDWATEAGAVSLGASSVCNIYRTRKRSLPRYQNTEKCFEKTSWGFGGSVVEATSSHHWGHGFDPCIEPLIARGKSLSTLYRKSWVFSGFSGFLPQGKLTGWVR